LILLAHFLRWQLRVDAKLLGQLQENITTQVDGSRVVPGRMSFREAVPPYLQFATANRRVNTVRGYTKLLHQICREEWTAKHLNDIERADIVR